ncbi:radical SAM protein, partial [Cribrihabitans sp. XS_ASV171]
MKDVIDRPDLSAMPPARRALRDACRMPRHYYIDICNVCNLRCPFCITGAQTNKLRPGIMSVADFRTIFDRIGDHAQLISLYNWGEPLMNPNLVEIIGIAASRGAKVHIDSNLATTDFTDAQAEALVGSGLHSLFASIGGVSQKVHETYRVRGKVNRALGNLRQLARAKVRLATERPILGWQYHIHKYNECEVGAARKLAAQMGVGIVFKKLNTPDPAWRSTEHHRKSPLLDGVEWFRRSYAPPTNPDLQAHPLHSAVANPCGQMFATMIVAWNGDVMPCTTVEGPDFAMGNLLRQTLEEVWHGEEFR